MRKTLTQIFPAGMAARLVALAVALGAGLGSSVSRAENAAPAASPQFTNTQEVLRAYQHMQEELRAVRQAVENNHRDAEDIAARNVQAMGERLNSIEQSIGNQRATELQALQSSNRLILIVTGVIVLLGLGIVAFAYLQWRTMHRFTEAALAFQVQQQLGGGARMAAIVDASEPRLLGVIERLEKRIHELEQMNQLPLPAMGQLADGKSISESGADARAGGALTSTPAASGKTDPTTLLLNKGQTLLSIGQNEAAVACFDEILAGEPANVEALIKKGTALEKLQKLNDAIACYDLAIEADQSVTIAYLYKGGVYNRLERYSEALECYEKALKTQPASAAA